MRPFCDHDVQDLVESVARWASFPPCTLDVSNSTPTVLDAPVDLVLYYARSVNAVLHEALSPILLDDDALWRRCFRLVSLLGGNLTEAQDQYHDMEDNPVTWNLGPNRQFYHALDYIRSKHEGEVFYYMEPDTIPIETFWLDRIYVEMVSAQPFSVLGSIYKGHNWDDYSVESGEISIALRYHINGNAVYNTSHPLLLEAAARVSGDPDWDSKPHTSFDFYISQMVYEERNVTDPAQAQAEHGYTLSDVMANFAQTLTLPQDLPMNTTVVRLNVPNRPSS